MQCPKCDGHIPFYDIRPNCKHCGVNIWYYTQRDLVRDAKRTEPEGAAARMVIARIKAAFIGSKTAIARLVITLGAFAILLLPFGSVRLIAPFYEKTLSAGLLGVIMDIIHGVLMKIPTYLQSAMFSSYTKKSDILEYPYDAGSVFNRKGEYLSDTYELVFKVDPAFEDAAALHESDVYKGICDALKNAVTVDKADLEVLEVELRFRIDRLTDQLQSVDLSRFYNVTATVTFTDAYAATVRDTGARQITVTMPYRATERISFMWYGLRFTQDYLEQKPNDMAALPLDVHVNFAAVQDEDFRLEYEISDPETLEIDKDAVLTVNKTNAVSDTEGIHVTAILHYDGKDFSDDIIIYVSEKDRNACMS